MLSVEHPRLFGRKSTNNTLLFSAVYVCVAKMPRILAPRNGDSFARTSNPSLRGSKTLLDQLRLKSAGSDSTSSSRRTYSTRNSRSKDPRFTLARRPSMQKQRSSLSSTSSLRRQKSSRQNSLLSYIQIEEPTKQNAEWNFTQAQLPKQNAFWDIVAKGPVSSQGPPSLASSENSESTENSSQETQQLQYSALPSPLSSLPSPADDAQGDLLQRFDLHRASLQHPAGSAPLPCPTILHPTNSLHRSRRSTSFLPSRIEEDDAWGHFVETADAAEDLDRRLNLLSMARKNCPASFSNFGPTRAW